MIENVQMGKLINTATLCLSMYVVQLNNVHATAQISVQSADLGCYGGFQFSRSVDPV